jgi:hypothetical protein
MNQTKQNKQKQSGQNTYIHMNNIQPPLLPGNFSGTFHEVWLVLNNSCVYISCKYIFSPRLLYSFAKEQSLQLHFKLYLGHYTTFYQVVDFLSPGAKSATEQTSPLLHVTYDVGPKTRETEWTKTSR